MGLLVVLYVWASGRYLERQLSCGGAICVGFSGVVGICLMRLPCVSATAEAVGIGILGIPHVLTS